MVDITMGDVTTPEADLDITAFGKNQSSVLLGQVDANSLQSGSSATVGAHALALGGGNSSVGGTLIEARRAKRIIAGGEAEQRRNLRNAKNKRDPR